MPKAAEIKRAYRRHIEENTESNRVGALAVKSAMERSPLYFHDRFTARTLQIPQIYDAHTVNRFREIVRTSYAIFTKVIDAYLRDPDYRKLFPFPRELEELILTPNLCDSLLPLARFDIFYHEDTGDFRFCEVNADGASGMSEDMGLHDLIIDNPAHQDVIRNYTLHSFAPFDNWVHCFLEMYRQYEQKKRRRQSELSNEGSRDECSGENNSGEQCSRGSQNELSGLSGSDEQRNQRSQGSQVELSTQSSKEEQRSPGRYSGLSHESNSDEQRSQENQNESSGLSGKDNQRSQGSQGKLPSLSGSDEQCGKDAQAQQDRLSACTQNDAGEVGSGTGFMWETGSRPTVVITDFLDIGTTHEFKEFARRFQKAGVNAEVCDIRSFTYRDGRLYSAWGHPVDAIYRRAVTSDVYAHRDEVKPFLQAVREGAVFMTGAFCTEVAHNKWLFYMLRQEKTQQFLTEEERDFVEKHIPETWLFAPGGISLEEVLRHKNDYILKPMDSYGSQGVVAGVECTPEEWKSRAEAVYGGETICQRYCPQYAEENIDFAWGDGLWHPYIRMAGLYSYGGEFGGVYARAAEAGGIIASKRNERTLPVYWTD